MHNTRSAIASLINRYKAVLKKCHLLNTFGSLALAGAVALSGICDASLAYGAMSGTTYTPTLDPSLYTTDIYTDLIAAELDTLGAATGPYASGGTWADFMVATGAYANWTAYESAVQTLLGSSVSSAYKVVSGSSLTSANYYTTFTVYSVGSDGTLSSTNYGVLLNDSYGNTTVSSSNALISSYLKNYTSKNSTIDMSGSTYSIGGVTFDVNLASGVTSGSRGTLNVTASDMTINASYKDLTKSSSIGGAYEFAAGSGVTIAIESIKGDYIGNSITGGNATSSGNGGALGFFANASDASVIVDEITGNFIGNSSVRAGGAIYLFTNNSAKTYIKEINSDFIVNSALYGGAIANFEGTIGKMTGSFIGNKATYYGGAIANYIQSSQGGRTSSITSIAGDFIGNSGADGGAIANYVYTYTSGTTESSVIIGDIVGDFIANTATGDGGAIYNFAHSSNAANTAIISTITGDFIGNSAGGSGGAIYNDDSSDSTALIGIITGDFISNTAGIYGGAIYNTSKINDINGSFINNTAGVFGGAIYNLANGESATLGNIVGDFIGNSVSATASLGGAIMNYSAVAGATATIGDITGNFISNSATKYGGAIYNDSNTVGDVTIGDITGNFIYNSVVALAATVGSVKGGAIYNDDTIGDIEGSFIGNYVIGNSSNDVAGGAIYTTEDMSFTATDQTNYFSDNYIAYYTNALASTASITGLTYNAITVGIDNITAGSSTSGIELDFTMSGSGCFVMNDSITGTTSYTALTTSSYETGTAIVSTTGMSIEYDNGTTSSVTGTLSKTVQTVTTTVEDTVDVVDSSGSTTTSDVTTVTAITTTTNYNADGSVDTSTVSTASTITTVDSNGNYTTTTSDADEASSATGSSSSTTYTTYTIEGVDTAGNSATATYTTDTNGVTTYAKTVVTNADGTIVTTTYDTSNTNQIGVSTADGTTQMTGATAFIMTVAGESKDKNIFYLNDEISNFGSFTISNATLYLGSYTHTNGTTTVGYLTALDSESSVEFGDNSQLTIDMSAYTSSIGTESALSTKAVITGNGASLKIADSSTLRLVNATTGYTYTILSGFSVADGVDIQGTDGSYAAWIAENVTVESSLQKIEVVRDGLDDTYDGTVETSTASRASAATSSAATMSTTNTTTTTTTTTTTGTVYALSVVYDASAYSPLYETSGADLVRDAASSTGFGPNSSNAGQRYLYNISSLSSDTDQKVAYEEGANLAKIAGVSTTNYRVNRLGSDALSSRFTNLGGTDSSVLAEKGSVGGDDGTGQVSKKYESVALWFVPMYGHDVVDGAKMYGYDVDFSTDIYGGVVGLDKTIDDGGAHVLGADLYRVGLAVHMGMGDTATSGVFNGVQNDFNFGGAFVYGVAEYGNLTLSADIGLSKVISQVKQDLSAYGISNAEANVYSDAWNVDLRVTYLIDTSALNITPYAGLELVSMKTNDYDVVDTSTMGGTIFNVSSDRQNILSIPVGVKLEKLVHAKNGWTVTPQMSLGAIFAAGDLDEYSSTTIPTLSKAGHTSMEVVDPVTFDMSVGLAGTKDNWQIGLDYELQMSRNRKGHALVGLVQYRF